MEFLQRPTILNHTRFVCGVGGRLATKPNGTSLRGHHVVSVDHRAIEMVIRAGSRLRVYRGDVDPSVVLAWELCGPPRCATSMGAADGLKQCDL
jgi:hypothetical protein